MGFLQQLWFRGEDLPLGGKVEDAFVLLTDYVSEMQSCVLQLNVERTFSKNIFAANKPQNAMSFLGGGSSAEEKFSLSYFLPYVCVFSRALLLHSPSFCVCPKLFT